MNGIINVYKEKGYTSHDVVAVLRKIAGQKRSVIQAPLILMRQGCFLFVWGVQQSYAIF